MTISAPDLVEGLLAGPRPLPIVSAGDPVLRRAAERFDGQLDPQQLSRFIEAMREAMLAAPGVGLAAPQVGVPLRIAVIEDLDPPIPPEIQEARERRPLPFQVLVNPSYEPAGSEQAAFFEGCLSVPGWQAVVTRPFRVCLRSQDENGRPQEDEFEGWPARIVQHETDHLNGTLYIDRAEIRSLSTHEAVAQRWSQPTPTTAAHELGFSLPSLSLARRERE